MISNDDHPQTRPAAAPRGRRRHRRAAGHPPRPALARRGLCSPGGTPTPTFVRPATKAPRPIAPSVRGLTRLTAVCVATTGISADLALPASAAQISPDVGQRAVALASQEAGDPYVFGAAGPDAFDCSGLVQYVYARLGVRLPRTTSAQFAAMERVPNHQARPGDVLFFHDSAGVIYHDAIYAGNGRMWAAPQTGKHVRLQAVYGSAWRVGRPSTAGAPTSASGALRVGSRGSAVADVQRALGITADGVFGPQTAAAVSRFQAGRGLTSDGIVGPATRGALFSGGAPAPGPALVSARPAPSSATGARPTLRQGSRGADVVALQRAIGAAPDGVFGPATRAAVVEHQRRAGLGTDGIVGPRTWATL